MAAQIELFDLYRWTLATVCAVYTLIQTGLALWRWLVYFGQTRKQAVLGRYVAVQLLRLRVRRFGFELAQIAVLLVGLGLVLWCHQKVG